MSKKRIVVIVFLLGVVVLGGVGAAGLWEYHEQPQFCATCHIMDPYLQSWQGSDYGAYAHAVADVTCLECHVPTLQQQMDELVVYVQGDFTVPLEERDFGDEFCFDCHETTEHTSHEEVIQLTADLDLNPHDSHLGQMKCATCHKMHAPSEDYCAQCHGPVATGPGWTTEILATAEIDIWAPDMDCSACHVMDRYLDSLQDPDLLAYTHARQGLECLDCHDAEEVKRLHEESAVGTVITPASFEMDFCFACHVPTPHTTDEAVVELTEDLDPNPHAGGIECYLCHQMHR